MLEFNLYKNNQRIEFENCNKTNNSKYYHFEIVEALLPCFLDAGRRHIPLHTNDIIICQGFKNITVHCKQSKDCLRHIVIDLKYPAPLNQYLVANNPLIHDFMNDNSKKLKYVVFKNLDELICHNYLNLLEIFAKQDKDTYTLFQAQRITGLLFTELLRNHRNKISKNYSDFPSNKVKYTSKYTKSGAIMSYISQKNGNVSLDDVANHFGYQRNYLSRLCHTLFRVDFIHLRMNIRMNLAREQLSLTTKSIEEIADELGYKNISTFTKQFTKQVKQTPSEYRKSNAIFK